MLQYEHCLAFPVLSPMSSALQGARQDHKAAGSKFTSITQELTVAKSHLAKCAEKCEVNQDKEAKRAFSAAEQAVKNLEEDLKVQVDILKPPGRGPAYMSRTTRIVDLPNSGASHRMQSDQIAVNHVQISSERKEHCLYWLYSRTELENPMSCRKMSEQGAPDAVTLTQERQCVRRVCPTPSIRQCLGP
jgi:hypothetical protein